MRRMESRMRATLLNWSGSDAKWIRVGDFGAIFEETADKIMVSKVTPRGNAYDALSSWMSR
jgi:hypothetical protein